MVKYYVELQRTSGTWVRDTGHFHISEAEAWTIACAAVSSG